MTARFKTSTVSDHTIMGVAGSTAAFVCAGLCRYSSTIPFYAKLEISVV
jgi:hypothetical protein